MPAEKRIETWAEFISVIERLDVSAGLGFRWLFRGQADASWSLIPSLTRMLKRVEIPLDRIRVAEYQLVVRFWSRAHLYLPSAMIRSAADPVGSWIVMQHYGVPTRLLDWTRSPYVAAYFALQDSIVRFTRESQTGALLKTIDVE